MDARIDPLPARALAGDRAAGRAWLLWRLALRELRGGLRGFLVFISCIALVLTAKQVRRLLKRDRDYYDD